MQRPEHPKRRSPAWMLRFGIQGLIGLGGLLAWTVPTHAAESIILSYGSLQRSISVESLEHYAETGDAPADLKPYLQRFDEQQKEQLRNLLQTQADLDHVAIAQFLYTRQGEILLQQLGDVIQTESYQPGFLALRGAMILAADSDEGLSLLSIVKKFPTDQLRIDLRETLDLMDDLDQLITQTAKASKAIQQQAEAERATEGTPDLSALPDWRSSGPFSSVVETFVMTDEARDRTLPVDLYLPTPAGNRAAASADNQRLPVIVISHGLGSDRTSYAYLARHLASYGFAVLVPEHPGSNSEQIQALIEGRVNQMTDPQEFVDRPLDIKFVLNQMEQMEASDPQLHLDLNNVGVIGQSLGGYTALVLAGATVDFRQLMADCIPTSPSFNLSLLLQCRVLDTAYPVSGLQDDRIKAAIAINPIGSSILGQPGFASIQRPVMIVTSTADTIAPALIEQIEPFTWLRTPDRYLLALQGATHFSTIGAVENEIPLPEALVGSDPAIAQRYMKAMSTPFFKTYLSDFAKYSPSLQAAYADQISQPALPVHLIKSLDGEQLSRAISSDADGAAGG